MITLSQQAQADIDLATSQLAAYKNAWYSTEHKTWLGKDETGQHIKADSVSIEHHQHVIRHMKQAILEIQQNDLFELFMTNQIEKTLEVIQAFNKISPLVMRRTDPFQMVRQILQKEPTADGELFSFSEPEEIITDVTLCGCGAINKSPVDMNEAEAYIAEKHLEECPSTKVEQVKAYSVNHNHKVGNWDCRACYKTQSTNKVEGVVSPFEVGEGTASTNWCPRFLRPFRTLSPEGYSSLVKNKSCYGGILHKQMSMILKDDKQYLLSESCCDTCGYFESNQTEITIPAQQANIS